MAARREVKADDGDTNKGTRVNELTQGSSSNTTPVAYTLSVVAADDARGMALGDDEEREVATERRLD